MPGGYKTVPTGIVQMIVTQASIAADVTYTLRVPCDGKIVAIDSACTTQGDVTIAVKNAGTDVVAAVAFPAAGLGQRHTLVEAQRTVARGGILTVVLDYTASTTVGAYICIYIRPSGQIAVSSSLDN